MKERKHVKLFEREKIVLWKCIALLLKKMKNITNITFFQILKRYYNIEPVKKL